MKISRTIHEYHEGSEAAARFKKTVKTILSIPHAEIERREKAYQKEQALKPKRGPKPKLKPSAVAHESAEKD
jgi:hypothetical protein